MTNENLKTCEIDISRDSNEGRKFAFVMLEKKTSLKDAFEKNFNVRFQKGANGSYANALLTFTCAPEYEENARKGYDLLCKLFSNGAHMSKEKIIEVAADIRLGIPVEKEDNANDNTATKKFNPAARPDNGQQHKKQKPAAGKVEPFKPKNEKQANLYKLMDDHRVTFAIGPAGTGKTRVAVAKAVEQLQAGKIEKIILARPAVSNGEKLGALPGGIEDKLAPYMRPLYDEMNDVLGNLDQLKEWMEIGIVEIVPVEMMRGRTFKKAFIIVDEAQNCTIEQTRMYLTRIGEGSTMVVAGDPKQVDLPNKSASGLQWAFDKLEKIAEIGRQFFTAADIVRDHIVSVIVNALDLDTEQNQPVIQAATPAAAQKNNKSRRFRS